MSSFAFKQPGDLPGLTKWHAPPARCAARGLVLVVRLAREISLKTGVGGRALGCAAVWLALCAASAPAQTAPSAATAPIVQCGNPPEYPSQGYMDAKFHINQLKGAWGWSSVGEANKDANGYPLRIGENGSVSKILNASPELSGVAPFSGTFRLYGQGIGDLDLRRGAARKQIVTARLPQETIMGETFWYYDFPYDPAISNKALVLAIRKLPIPGDHIRNLALVHHSHLANWRRGERIMPEVIADLSVFGREQRPTRGALRFMQLTQSNLVWAPDDTPYTAQTDAMRERRYVSPGFYSFARMQNPGTARPDQLVPTSLPIEDIVELSNRTGTNVWYALPPDILDQRVRQIARYMRDHLDPELMVYWEYGNELWNSARGFDGYQYAEAKGMEAFPALKKTEAVYEWDVYRSMQVFSIIRDEFAATPDRARFMATFWAIAASNKPGGATLPGSYAGRYFAAEYARQKPDMPVLPEDIITDMSVGAYFSDPPDDIQRYLMRLHGTAPAAVAAYKKLVLRGIDGPAVSLDKTQLKTPLRDITPDTMIGAYGLIRDDIEAGLDPLSQLAKVLRLRGDTLQYKGVNARKWTEVLRFSSPPATSGVAAMEKAGTLTGFGRKFYGREMDGFITQIETAYQLRLLNHRAFARSHGLKLHFYEGGPGRKSVKKPEENPQIVDFLNEYHNQGAARDVMETFLTLVEPDLTQFCWYKTHNRYSDTGYWGLKKYYGQPGQEAPKWALIEDLARRDTAQ